MQTTEGLCVFIEYHRDRARQELISQHTLLDYEALSQKLEDCLPGRELTMLKPSHFRTAFELAGKSWSPTRLHKLKIYLKSWLKFLGEEGLMSSVPATGRLQLPKKTRTVKRIYTPGEIRALWQDSDRPMYRSMIGLGLFGGTNCGDLQDLSEDHFDGQYFIRPRVKTGNPRRAWLPSFVVKEIHAPLVTKYGTLRSCSVSNLWAQFTQRVLGERRQYTALRTTLRTVAGQVDGEACELAVMGLSPSSASGTLGRSVVGLNHYVNVAGISDDRLRAVGKSIMTYMQSWLAPRDLPWD